MIPTCIKNITKCCDYEANRYDLTFVSFETIEGKTHAVATDGRVMAIVTFPNKDQINGLVEPVVLIAAATVAESRKQSNIKSEALPTVEGKFPDWRAVAIEPKRQGGFQCFMNPTRFDKLLTLANSLGINTLRIIVPSDNMQSVHMIGESDDHDLTFLGILSPMAGNTSHDSSPEIDYPDFTKHETTTKDD